MNRFPFFLLLFSGLCTSALQADQREQWAKEALEGATKAEAMASNLEAEALKAKAMVAFQFEVDAQIQKEIASQKKLLAGALRANDDATARALHERIKQLASRPVPAPEPSSGVNWSSPAANWNASTPLGLANDPTTSPPTGPAAQPSKGPELLLSKLSEQADNLDRKAEEKRKQGKEDRDIRRAAYECADLLEERATLLRQIMDATKAGNAEQLSKLERKLKSQNEDFAKLAKKYNDASLLPIQLFGP